MQGSYGREEAGLFDRVIIIVMDSVGNGELPDAHLYGDDGANTLGHIYRDIEDFSLPTLEKLGIGISRAPSTLGKVPHRLGVTAGRRRGQRARIP